MLLVLYNIKSDDIVSDSSKTIDGFYNYSIYNQLLLNILQVISQKYGHNL